MKSRRLKFAVTGAIETHGASLDALELAKRLGREVGKAGHLLITGAQHGFPLFAAIGAKERRGETLYISPAANEREHRDIYRLDGDHGDIVIYTGFGGSGAQIFATRAADAVIVGCGKLDALHEFTLALQEGKPVGVLRGAWETDEVIKRLVGEHPKSHMAVVFEDDPERLVAKLVELIK